MKFYKLCVYTPETHLIAVKTAIFESDAGKYNNYDSCCWQVKGVGQFRPLEGSNAFIGKIGKLEEIVEFRIETIVSEENLEKVTEAVYHSHPYETPAFDFTEIIIPNI